MRNFCLCLFFLLFSMTSWAQEENIEIRIKQAGRTLALNDGVVNLKSGEFVFEVTSKNIEGFLIGATFDRNVYLSALGELDNEVSWFENTGVADDMFNPSKEIIVSDEVTSFWYYTNAKEHRFDKNPKGTVDNWVGTRTIKFFNNLSAYELIPVSEFKKSLYVFIYNPIYDEDYNVVSIDLLFNAELKFN